MKKLYFILLIALILPSCNDFLEEENFSSETASTSLESEDGVERLINAAYVNLRIWYGKENGWDFTEAGTDIYTFGLDIRSQAFCDYRNFQSTSDEAMERIYGIWRQMYKAINTCNLILENIDDIPYANPALRNIRKAEVAFLRAHYLWQLTETWGEIHLQTSPTTTIVSTAYRTSIEEIYAQIFKDLELAELLASPGLAANEDYGRITLPIVQSFLARTHLTWASYKKNGLSVEVAGDAKQFISIDNAVANDHYTKALQYAQAVITSGYYNLINWSDIWNINNINNSEAVWAVNYSKDATYTNGQFTDANGDLYLEESNNTSVIQRAGGHQGCFMFEIRYENMGWGMIRDVQNGRGFIRWAPTKFYIDLFNENLDTRFFGSFKDTWYANDLATIPVWPATMTVNSIEVNVDPAKVGQPIFNVGDTCIHFSKIPIPASRKASIETTGFPVDPDKGYVIMDIDDMYDSDEALSELSNRQYFFPITKKYEDPTRLNSMTAYSKRDFYVIRISEMYLIAAEAELMLTNAGGAYDYLKTLADSRATGNDGTALLAAYGVSGGSDVDIDFILDERARELGTEMLRFFDLKRTGTLLTRVKAHNTDAQSLQDYHVFRPFPIQQIDAVSNKTEFTQNPGY